MRSHLILAGATLALSSAFAAAQSTAKPTPYEGVSQPPVSDVISASEDAPAATAPAAAATVQSPAPKTAPQSAPHTTLPAPAPAPRENPDYGIVEAPVNGNDAAVSQSPALHDRSGKAFNPSDDIVNSVPGSGNVLAVGTPIHTRLNRQLDSSENGAGTVFTAQVVEDVQQNGRVIIPDGSIVHGRVLSAEYGRRIGGHASIRLFADEVTLPDGTHYWLNAVPSMTGAATRTRVNSEGAILTRDNPKTLAAQYGVASGAGAATGAVLGGPVGAMVGGSIGAGVITAHFLVNRQVAVLPNGSSITFALNRPMQVTPLTNTASR